MAAHDRDRLLAQTHGETPERAQLQTHNYGKIHASLTLTPMVKFINSPLCVTYSLHLGSPLHLGIRASGSFCATSYDLHLK